MFHEPEFWKHEPQLVREAIRCQVEDEDFNFEGCHFPEINFSQVVKNKEIGRNVNFRNAHFHENISFSRSPSVVRFREADFRGAVFHKDADFSDVEFTFADFTGVVFSGAADFEGARFFGVFFICSKFAMFTSFDGARFYGDAYFHSAEFNAGAQFKSAKFFHEARFLSARFLRIADFSRASFYDRAFFAHAAFSGGVAFWGIDMAAVRFDFSYAVFYRELLVDEVQWSSRRYRIWIEETNLKKAMMSYHTLKKAFLAMGNYRLSGELFYNEMRCRQRLLSACLRSFPNLLTFLKPIYTASPLKNLVGSFVKRIQETQIIKYLLNIVYRQDTCKYDDDSRGFWDSFGDWVWLQVFYYTCGFGERPLRVVGMSFLTIFLFAIAYWLAAPISIFTALYLSCDCFVAFAAFQNDTVPFDFRWLMYLEAAIGIAIMSLFLVTFTRKMMRD
jgi:uncharacterized protein YjbI with pentapeptide repeats